MTISALGGGLVFLRLQDALAALVRQLHRALAGVPFHGAMIMGGAETHLRCHRATLSDFLGRRHARGGAGAEQQR